jgi:hypothetical protein
MFDQAPPAPPAIHFYVAQESILNTQELPLSPAVEIPVEKQPLKSSLPEAPAQTDGTPALKGQAEVAQVKDFNPKAIWGPVSGRMIPETKKTLAKIMSSNIRDLSEDEYAQFRYLIEYILTNPASRDRVFELTGFQEKDLLFAEKYFRRYDGRRLFSKLVEIALATSSNGNVSRQVGGMLQFMFETEEINGEKVPDGYKYKFMRGIPNLEESIWTQVGQDCQNGGGLCTDANKAFLDLNDDGKVDAGDVEIGLKSIQWLKSQKGFQ